MSFTLAFYDLLVECKVNKNFRFFQIILRKFHFFPPNIFRPSSLSININAPDYGITLRRKDAEKILNTFQKNHLWKIKIFFGTNFLAILNNFCSKRKKERKLQDDYFSTLRCLCFGTKISDDDHKIYSRKLTFQLMSKLTSN